MRTHGWAGDPPASDEEAVARIKAAVHRCIAQFGGNTTISNVATDLGVSRQTVYRYFPGTEALLLAAAQEGTADFLRRLARRLRPFTDPGEAVVEAIGYTIDQVHKEPYLALLLAGTPNSLVRSVTSEMARAVGRSVLEQTSVDWGGQLFSSAGLDDLIEWTLRTVQSFLIDPGDPVRTPAQLRSFLRRWLAPAVNAKSMVQA